MKDRKLITELNNFTAILVAIKEGNCGKLLFNLHSIKDLHAVDPHGKSLLTIIQESSIDINKRISIELVGMVFKLTPLEQLMSGTQNPSIERLQVVLALGANVNNEFDSSGNTLLHKYVQRQNVNPGILKMFLDAGGDFLQKNKNGQTPIDLAPKEIATHLKKLMAKQNKEQQHATKIQRQWRLHAAKKTKAEAKSVLLTHPLLDREAEEPKENPPDKEKMEQWINAHDEEHRATARKVAEAVQYISPKHFLFGLKMAIKKFNKHLLSLPEADRNYVLVIDRRDDKSGWWVTKLAEKHLAFPPKKIITTGELEKFKPDDDIRHIVVMDDISYSGKFFYKFLTAFRDEVIPMNNSLMPLQLHLILPCMSEESQARFKEFNVILHCQETIPNFSVAGTLFTAKTATYPAHKNPDSEHSAIAAIGEGKSIEGKETGVKFVAQVEPPYKRTKP